MFSLIDDRLGVSTYSKETDRIQFHAEVPLAPPSKSSGLM
jgi:hypothetical protein